MRRRSWLFWVGVVLAGLLGAGIIASLTFGLWRFASYGPRVGGMYAREGFRVAHGGFIGPGPMGFGFIAPLAMIVILGLAAFGLYALFSRNHRTRWDAWPTCPNCHRLARYGWRFCPHCGHPLGQPVTAPVQPATPSPAASSGPAPSAPANPPPNVQPQPTSG